MALNKTVSNDKIEVIGKFKHVHVRQATVIDEDGTVLYTYRYVKPKVTLDSKKVKELYPDVYEECTKVGEPSRRFVNKRKSEPEFKI